MKTTLLFFSFIAFLITGCANSADGINSPSCTIAPPIKNINKPTIGTNFGKKN